MLNYFFNILFKEIIDLLYFIKECFLGKFYGIRKVNIIESIFLLYYK